MRLQSALVSLMLASSTASIGNEEPTMLDHILACAQAFQREHGVQPNVVYINHEHHRALLALYPALFEGDPHRQLGVRLIIVPSRELIHPQAAHVAWQSACA
jgi:hypothetical protein